MDDRFSLADEVSQALMGDVDLQRLEGFSFARRVLPFFALIRALFSSSQADTCLKLMLLYELTRRPERSSIEQIRRLVPYIESGRVEGMVRSLREGGWLELSASDSTYSVSISGASLLTALLSADPGTLSSANHLARAAQFAAFSASLAGADDASPYLLEHLLTLLRTQIDEARQILQSGRPQKLIRFSQAQHGQQLEVIRQVLGVLETRLENSTQLFTLITRLHLAMQEIVRLHASLHSRILDWNLEKLYTSEAGYSVEQLCQTLLGLEEDAPFREATDLRLVQVPAVPPSLTLEELKSRFHGARRRLPSQEVTFTYTNPATPTPEPFNAADLEPASVLRALLTRLLAQRSQGDPPLELEEWLEGPLPEATYTLAILSQLQGKGPSFALDDGRFATIAQKSALLRRVPAEDVLRTLESLEVLTSLPAGFFSAIALQLKEPSEDASSYASPRPSGDST